MQSECTTPDHKIRRYIEIIKMKIQSRLKPLKYYFGPPIVKVQSGPLTINCITLAPQLSKSCQLYQNFNYK